MSISAFRDRFAAKSRSGQMREAESQRLLPRPGVKSSRDLLKEETIVSK